MISSLFLGSPGQYSIGDLDIEFKERCAWGNVFGSNWFSNTVDLCLGNRLFCILTLGYFHVFFHEMGHVLAAKVQGYPSSLYVYLDTCRGEVINSAHDRFTTLAGPAAGMLLEVAKLVAAVALILFFPPPIGIPLGIALGSGAVIWLFGETMYSLSGEGDWA